VFLGTFVGTYAYTGRMDKLINLKYLTQNNGYWQYERRVPKAVLSHPYWGEKKSWKRPLGLKVGAPVEDVLSAWKALHQTFETSLANIQERNPHILDKRERRRRAEAHLKMFDLNPHDGSLEGIDDDNERSHQPDYIDNIRELSGAFDDYVHWEQTHQMRAREEGSGLKPRVHLMPPEVQLQREAWIAYTEDKSIKAPIVFSDLWDIYALGKNLDLNDRKNKKTLSRWKSFMNIVGDEVLTNQTINDGLRAWVNAQRGRKVQDQTLKRELGVIRAVLNFARQAKALDLQWVIPQIDIKTEENQRPVISKEDYQSFWELIQDETEKKYRPWKEFVFTILCQSSTILSELMRLERKDIHLDGETAYINLYNTELKTKDRKRVVPLPFRTDRVEELLDAMDDGQESALPPSLVQMTDNKLEWVTSESNINRQLNDYIKMCDSKTQGYTTYSTRHSFKLYLQLSGANPMDILYLAGWAGDNGQSQMLKHFGRQGIGSPEMVKRLEVAVRSAMHFLSEHDEKVVQLYRS
jgi:integrase